MSKKKVLVCGATGFIGRNIAEAFAGRDEYEIFATHFKRDAWPNPKIKWLQVDLRDPEQVDRAVRGMDVIVQAAATTSGSKEIVTKPYFHVTDNAVMNSYLFRSAFEHQVKQVVFFSCTVMYHSSDTPVAESDFDANAEIHPRYFGVGWTKVYLEKMAEFYSRISSTKYTVIRHSNIYGPHDKYDLEKSHVFGATVAKVMNASDGKVVVWGSGEEERDLLYVSDLVRFVELALEKQTDPYSLVNAGYGDSISVKDLVQKVIDQSGRPLKIEFDPTKPTIKTKLCLNCELAKKKFGWKPLVSLDEGIRRSLVWYRDHVGNTCKS